MPTKFSKSLIEVAEDARELIRAFRENGAISFGSISVELARANYRRSCELNGIAKEDIASIRSIDVPVGGGVINVRIYDNSADDEIGPRPIIFFVHGGGWVIGDLETHDAICRFIAKQTNFAVAAVDYRLSPEFPYPIPLDDCRKAFDYLSRNEAEVGISMRKVVLFGDSAGANMAAVIANELARAHSGPEIIAQVLLYPVTDLTMSSNSYRSISDGFPLISASMHWFADNYIPTGVDRSVQDISPLLGGFSGPRPATFIVTVGYDPLCDEGIAYAGELARTGTRVVHHHLPHHMHGLFTAAGKIETGRHMLLEAVRFIEDCSRDG